MSEQKKNELEVAKEIIKERKAEFEKKLAHLRNQWDMYDKNHAANQGEITQAITDLCGDIEQCDDALRFLEHLERKG